ncbi:hypothetical protein IMG5_122900 [Ichthyophthirius multifiliis]|uniref:Uncharacterized protein n=1 Tax=Ichthyophthirius multifiliis TaxID=5932 RepID=G0QVC9_ICHMU|nr:hypothetical protein IMG5_122900 [Ichthyophthirius multifiliis]EGR30818.1 hypothetical protein IMG5_122900 [Ichthyophthirius multifiliis]|eukprot:XP_004032405.1 hypothetical protein IMG5_122900 [Ichthyophthirius multifiliis]
MCSYAFKQPFEEQNGHRNPKTIPVIIINSHQRQQKTQNSYYQNTYSYSQLMRCLFCQCWSDYSSQKITYHNRKREIESYIYILFFWIFTRKKIKGSHYRIPTSK